MTNAHRGLLFSSRGPGFEAHNRSEEHTSELQSQSNLVCRLLLDKKKVQHTRDYLAAAYLLLNAWERALADASSARMVHAGVDHHQQLTKMQLENQKEIAEMQNETQKEIAGIQSATSRQNTKDQVYAQNEMLAYQQMESTARVASIMFFFKISKQPQVSPLFPHTLLYG